MQKPAAGSMSSAESTAIVQKEARRNTETDLNLLNQRSHTFVLPPSQLFDMLLLGKSENTHIIAQIKHADETQLCNVGFALCTSQNG